MTDAENTYDSLAAGFLETDGVTVQADGMYAHGRLFAFLDRGELVVELPLGRLGDLELRGVAAPYVSTRHPTRDWVTVSDAELWPELAREAYDYVAEPPVGGES
jgi:hypothetical protein